MDKEAAQSLRAVVHDCLAKHMYEAAAFFADKLVTLTGYGAVEVYTLAQAFFCSRQFRRCLQLLRSTELVEKDLRFRYLAARWAARNSSSRSSSSRRWGGGCQRWHRYRHRLPAPTTPAPFHCPPPHPQVPGRVQGVGGVPGGAGRPGGRGARGTSPGAAAAAALADTPRLCYQLLLGSLPAARVGVGQHAACCGGAVQALNWIAQTLGHGTYGCCSANAPTHPPLLPLDPWPPCLPPLFSLLCLPACRRVHDALENFPRAVRWYKAALQEDPLNYEVRPVGCWQLCLFACRLALLCVGLWLPIGR